MANDFNPYAAPEAELKSDGKPDDGTAGLDITLRCISMVLFTLGFAMFYVVMVMAIRVFFRIPLEVPTGVIGLMSSVSGDLTTEACMSMTYVLVGRKRR